MTPDPTTHLHGADPEIRFPEGYTPTPQRMTEILFEAALSRAVAMMEDAGMSEAQILAFIPEHLAEICGFVDLCLKHPASQDAYRRCVAFHSQEPTP